MIIDEWYHWYKYRAQRSYTFRGVHEAHFLLTRNYHGLIRKVIKYMGNAEGVRGVMSFV